MDDSELLDRARKDFARAKDYWEPQFEIARLGAEFRGLRQWDEALIASRGDRPSLVWDQLPKFCNRVVNQIRTNPPSPVAYSEEDVDSEHQEWVSKALLGVCRNSRIQEVAGTAVNNVVNGGIGWVTVALEYKDDDSFDLIPRIKRVRDYDACLIDPCIMERNGSDARFGFEQETIDKKSYEAQYGDSISAWNVSDDDLKNWTSDDSVRIVVYYYVEDNSEYLVKANGKSITVSTEEELNNLASQGVLIEGFRKRQKRVVKWAKLSAGSVLDKGEFGAPYVPIVPVLGSEHRVGSAIRYHGIVQPLMDYQRVINFAISYEMEAASLGPRVKVLYDYRQVPEALQNVWKDVNSKNLIGLPYDGSQVNTPPTALNLNADVAGLTAARQSAISDMREALGFSGFEGSQVNDSGRAVLLKQKAEDMATADFSEFVNDSFAHVYKIVYELLRNLKPESMPIFDQEQGKAISTKAPNGVWDIKFGIQIDTGKNYSTRKQEALDSLLALVEGDPESKKMIADVVVNLLDIDKSTKDKVAKRFQLALPPEMQDERKEEDPQAVQVIEQITQQRNEVQEKLDQMMGLVAYLQQELQNKSAEIASEEKIALLKEEGAMARESMKQLGALNTLQLKSFSNLEKGINDAQQRENVAVARQDELLQNVEGALTSNTIPRVAGPLSARGQVYNQGTADSGSPA